MGLRILPLGNSLGACCILKRWGHISVPYEGYVGANLTIPDLPWYNEDVLFLVISDHKYGKRVPVQIGTQVIDHFIATLTKKELQQAGDIWKHLSTIISKRNRVKGLHVPKDDIEGVKGKIHIIREIIILPFQTTVVKGIAN